MSVTETLKWQWSVYAKGHASRRNLFIHIIAVPVFMAGSLLAVGGAASASLPPAGLGIAAMVLSLALQGRGHRLEAVPPDPFRGPADILLRILLEQWVTFPRYVVTGGWYRAFRAAS
ncbi:MAG: hypothetical protein WBG82_16250 [Parvibaculum sp.]|uniref:hypothetical protein n=1 Tax=Parvibaculum sp. TaxID=2024848 RepID=UPI003C722FBD